MAHLWDHGWNGEPLAVGDYPRAFEQVLGYIARTGLRTPVIFTDFYEPDRSDRRPATRSRSGTRSTRPTTSPAPTPRPTGSAWSRPRPPRWKTIAWAAQAPTKGDANDAWRNVLGPGFEGA